MLDQIVNLLTLPDTPLYNIKAVVHQTQVTFSTLRAWEQRYGVPAPHRSAHGHRLYSERDVEIITWLRQCTENGMAISQAVAMLRDSHLMDETAVAPSADAPPEPRIAAPPPGARPAPQGPMPHTTASDDLTRQLLHALLHVDLRQAHLLVNTACSLLPTESLVLDVFQPLLHEVGSRWARGDVSVVEEHLVSNFIRQRLLSLTQVHAPFASGPRLVCCCAPGEQHEIGLLMFALLMEQRGWEVVYLGQNVALDGLGSFLMRVAPALVCVSISIIEHLPGMIDLCRLVKSYEQNYLTLTYSGRIFDMYPEFQQRVPGRYLGSDLRAAVDALVNLADVEHVQGSDSSMLNRIVVMPRAQSWTAQDAPVRAERRTNDDSAE